MAWMGQFLWPFVRALALLMTAPLISHASVPNRVKVGLAFAIAIVVAPLVPPNLPSPASPEALGTLVYQVAVGAVIGLSARLAFAAVELAGEMIGLQMGLSFATFIDPQNSQPAPLIGSFLGLIAMLVFLAVDGHLALVGSLAESFRVSPASFLDMKAVVRWGSEMFRFGLHISLPVVAAMLVANIALAILVRAAPQLNLFSVGFPATLLIGLLVMATSLPAVLPLILAAIRAGLPGLP